MGVNSRASRRKLHAASGCLRTANNAGQNDKAVQEIVRIPKTVKAREVLHKYLPEHFLASSFATLGYIASASAA